MSAAHVLDGITAPSSTSRKWHCSCGTDGITTQAYSNEDLVAKARRNWRGHVKRATA